VALDLAGLDAARQKMLVQYGMLGNKAVEQVAKGIQELFPQAGRT